MGASQLTDKLDGQVYVKLNNTLTSGITKSDYSRPIAEQTFFNVDGREVVVAITVNSLIKNIASDAALAFGEHIFTYPSGIGIIQPLYTSVKLLSTCPTGLSATAGEVGMGSVVASGANATLGAVGATCENIMEGTTLSNHVAATPLTSKKGNFAVAFGDHGATSGTGVLDASAADVKAFLNLASTWNQTAAENVTFSATIVHRFRVLGTDFGVL